jgi:hypothetical protein
MRLHSTLTLQTLTAAQNHKAAREQRVKPEQQEPVLPRRHQMRRIIDTEEDDDDELVDAPPAPSTARPSGEPPTARTRAASGQTRDVG